jgi:two-component system CheB/CheR fusion protein
MSISRDTLPPDDGPGISKTGKVNDNASGADYSQLRDVTVLVVDDDKGVRDAVAEMLGRMGAQVRVAQSAADAMTAIDEFRPQVLLCDIAIPGEDGYTFLRRLRARGPTRGGNIPALALTALAGEGDRGRALAAGFHMHMTKPVDADRLKQAVIALATGASQALTMGASSH